MIPPDHALHCEGGSYYVYFTFARAWRAPNDEIVTLPPGSWARCQLMFNYRTPPKIINDRYIAGLEPIPPLKQAVVQARWEASQ